MGLFDLVHTSGGAHQVWLKDRKISLTDADLQALANGQRLTDEHPLTRALKDPSVKAKVMFSDPFMQKPGPLLKEADEFAFNLQRAYPDVSVYRDPLSERTASLVKRLNEVVASRPSEMVAIVADSSFRRRPKDYNLIQDLKVELEKAGVRVIKYSSGSSGSPIPPIARGKGLIIITGHSSDELADFVRTLGQAGVFRDNYVLFNSCETPLSRQVITEINTRYAAVATFAHQNR
jgi:hypothetical protein